MQHRLLTRCLYVVFCCFQVVKPEATTCKHSIPWMQAFTNEQFIISFKKYQSEALHWSSFEAIITVWDPSLISSISLRNPKYPTDFLLWNLQWTSESQRIHILTQISEHIPEIKAISRNQLMQGQVLSASNASKTPFKASDHSQTNSVNGVDYVKDAWQRGFKGQNVKIGVFDTGLAPSSRQHFHHVEDITNWTNEQDLVDSNGHGTFVAGVIAGSVDGCLGIAPEASIYAFRVFTSESVVYTSWFLDAINYAIYLELDVLNFSIGGPDFEDLPFVDKVREASSHGIIVVSAAGNSGPYYGILTNPADQMDVIGVGGLTEDLQKIASFSARGLTTWEIDSGYGRVKPDVMALGVNVVGQTSTGKCIQLNGTSMAAPLVTGAVALILSAMTASQRQQFGNPGFIKALLLTTATRLESRSIGSSTLNNEWHHIYEQGAGRLNLSSALSSMELMMKQPKVVILPGALDLTDCPYTWPHCNQAIYHDALPVIIHPTAVSSRLMVPPEWIPGVHGDLLDVQTITNGKFIPYTGAIGLYISVKAPVLEPIVAQGRLRITLENAVGADLVIKIPIQPTPPRHKRVILWDQFRNLQYPSLYVPKDDLHIHTSDPFDSHGDHPHTNFADLWMALRTAGYAVEIASVDYTCLELSKYGLVLVVDPEEPWFDSEIQAMTAAIREQNVSLVVIGGWYNLDTMNSLEIWDTNTLSHWQPVVGGSNVPAINQLLESFNIALGDTIWTSFPLHEGTPDMFVESGSGIVSFPIDGHLYFTQLRNITSKSTFLSTALMDWKSVPVVGSTQVSTKNGGRIIVMGDASCLDSINSTGMTCFKMFLELVAYALSSTPLSNTGEWTHLASNPLLAAIKPPMTQPDTELWKESKVLGPNKKPGQCLPVKKTR
uniref:subtilisin n=1 Tax=Thraustotheca clavata TaxID=74557 RepID=A0A0A7CLN0_9STRA|nr:secreted protein [Thraustotheca clavata]